MNMNIGLIVKFSSIVMHDKKKLCKCHSRFFFFPFGGREEKFKCTKNFERMFKYYFSLSLNIINIKINLLDFVLDKDMLSGFRLTLSWVLGLRLDMYWVEKFGEKISIKKNGDKTNQSWFSKFKNYFCEKYLMIEY